MFLRVIVKELIEHGIHIPAVFVAPNYTERLVDKANYLKNFVSNVIYNSTQNAGYAWGMVISDIILPYTASMSANWDDRMLGIDLFFDTEIGTFKRMLDIAGALFASHKIEKQWLKQFRWEREGLWTKLREYKTKNSARWRNEMDILDAIFPPRQPTVLFIPLHARRRVTDSHSVVHTRDSEANNTF